jgi:hypothetical protein
MSISTHVLTFVNDESVHTFFPYVSSDFFPAQSFGGAMCRPWGTALSSHIAQTNCQLPHLRISPHYTNAQLLCRLRETDERWV